MQKQKKDIVDIAILLLSFSTLKKINYWFLVLFGGLFLSVLTLYSIMIDFDIQSNVFKNVYLYIIPFLLYSYFIHIIIKKLSKDVLVGIILLIYFFQCFIFYRITIYTIFFIIVLFLLLLYGINSEWSENGKNNK